MENKDEQRRQTERGGGSARREPEPKVRRSAASTITAGELALVCARYDVGVITRVERLKRGSGSSPKVVMETSTGKYILKRLAPARSDPKRVAFGHELVLYLLARAFPAPGLIGTRAGNNSMLQMRGYTYELYRYIEGREDAKSTADARAAGCTLAVLHRTLDGFAPTGVGVPSAGTFHDSVHVPTALARIPKRFDDPDRREVTLGLLDEYRRAAVEARATERDWKSGPFIHGDWHPGNMLFRIGGDETSGVVCVLDFDSARPGHRVIDVANGALQFAMSRPADSTPSIPEASSTSSRTSEPPGSDRRGLKSAELDVDRYRAFLEGYHFGLGGVLTSGERRAVPWLMIQALIGEAAVPIAITGRFGKVDPMGLLRVVRRKVGWIARNADALIN